MFERAKFVRNNFAVHSLMYETIPSSHKKALRNWTRPSALSASNEGQ